jgi:hypothetical protein
MKVRNTRSDQRDLIATDQCNADEPNALRFAFIPCVLRAASFARDYEYKRHGTATKGLTSRHPAAARKALPGERRCARRHGRSAPVGSGERA